MNLKIFLIYFVMMASMCCGEIGDEELLIQDGPVYCGRTFARILDIVCSDDPFNVKTSDAGTMFNSILKPNYKEQENRGGWPWSPHHIARSMNNLSRRKRSIIQECCEKACDISDMLAYC